MGNLFDQNCDGTGSYSIPIQTPPGFLAPSIALSYNSGGGKSEVGIGFKLPRFFIYRTTDKGLPHFNESDRFAVQGPQFNDELVLVNEEERYYRLKNEGAFALFVRDTESNSWRVRLPNGEDIFCGESVASRQYAGQGAFRWFANRHVDRFDHEKQWHYIEDEGHVYLSAIKYQLHASTDYQNTVTFAYETRPDVYTDYTYGTADTTSQRLRNIDVYHGDRLIRTYSLSYQNEALYSLLSGVSMLGEDDLSMPPLSFEYAQNSPQARPLVTMASTPNTDGLVNGRAILDDVNGDGLPDILYGDANNYRYYENIDGYSWSEFATSLSGAPDQSLQDAETLLADMNGDGFRDVVFKYGEEFRFYPSGQIVNGQLLGFGPYETLSTVGAPSYHWGLNTVKISDLNRDGRTDMLYQPSSDSLKQIINENENVLEESNLTSLPLDVSFTDPKISLTDFNGDGHLDFVKKDINYANSASGSRIRVWFGLGWGAYAPEQEMAFVPTGDPNEFYLQDVNKDGQADLVRISGSWVTYYLNTGRMSFTSSQGDFYGNPTSGQSQTILFGDMNGNTTTDIVWVMNDGKIKYLDLTVAPYMGLLTQIHNGMGAVTTLTYKSSTDYMIEAKEEGRPWQTPLRTPVQVLQSIETTDSLEKLAIEPAIELKEYVYFDGYYDGSEREFRGFREVVTYFRGDDFHETLVETQKMHVGIDEETGLSQESLKGKPLQIIQENLNGELIASTERFWSHRFLCQEDLEGLIQVLPNCSLGVTESTKDSNVALGVETGTVIGRWEKQDDPKWIFKKQEFDIWGSMTNSYEYGEVLFEGGRSIGDPLDEAAIDVAYGNDERFKENHFINDTNEWLLKIKHTERTTDDQGIVLRANRFYYDGEPEEGLPLGQVTTGLLKRTSVWLKDLSQERWIDETRKSYTPHGKVRTIRDATDFQQELAYDSATGFMLAGEYIYGASEELAYTAQSDLGTGLMMSAVNYNGGQFEFTYDGLNRLTSIYPGDNEEQPTRRFEYRSATAENPISLTKIYELKNRERGTYSLSRNYSDCFSRTRLIVTETERENTYRATGWVQMTGRNQTWKKFEPYFTNTHEFLPPPDSVPQLGTTFQD